MPETGKSGARPAPAPDSQQGKVEVPQIDELPAQPIAVEPDQPMPLPGPQPQTDVPGQRPADEQERPLRSSRS